MKDEFKGMKTDLDTAIGDYRAVIGQQNQQIAGIINVIYLHRPVSYFQLTVIEVAIH